GIRDLIVTGVQTCALPISPARETRAMDLGALATAFALIFVAELPDKTAYTVLLLAARSKALPVLLGAWAAFVAQVAIAFAAGSRSEERRVGEGGGSRVGGC